MSDLSRPNHYAHDSLGDPSTCTGDHNHPAPETDDPRFAGLAADVVERAKQAKCSVCGQAVVEAKGMTGTVMVSYYVPALQVRNRVILCGEHGLGLREFLHPHILQDPVYLAVKEELRKRW